MKLYGNAGDAPVGHFLRLRYEQISSAVKRNEHNVRLENFLDEITVISQMDLAPLNTPVLSAMRRLLK